jgi:hypothetical protein
LKCLPDSPMAGSVRTPGIEPYPAVRQEKPATTRRPAQRAHAGRSCANRVMRSMNRSANSAWVSIAGAILQYASWRWLFLVNLPVGALAIVLAVLFLPSDREETRSRELDLPGLVLLISLVLLAFFFRIAKHKEDRALIDLRLFRNKTFSAAAATQFMTNGISFAGQMLIPIYLIRACGQSPSATGWFPTARD